MFKQQDENIFLSSDKTRHSLILEHYASQTHEEEHLDLKVDVSGLRELLP